MTDSLENRTHEEVQRYYGETLESSADLKTSACCTSAAPPARLREALDAVHEEVSNRYYGCGLVLPDVLDGLQVLDLGCGAGRDVYLLSKLVGEQGSVVGVDMTPAQLEVARRYRDYHAETFGYVSSNVEFLEGNIERLDELDLADGSFDLIVSNCVINLAVDKAAVLRSAFRLLAPGGEMYFSDIYADRRIPAELAADPVLYGECLSGALYARDFLDLAHTAGFAPPRLCEAEPLLLTDPEIAAKTGDIGFCSATFRLFKLDNAESSEEDYGLQATYRGGVEGNAQAWRLDADYVFPAGRPVAISGNTGKILQQSRFSQYFDISGDFTAHFGEFSDQTLQLPFADQGRGRASGGCC